MCFIFLHAIGMRPSTSHQGGRREEGGKRTGAPKPSEEQQKFIETPSATAPYRVVGAAQLTPR